MDGKQMVLIFKRDDFGKFDVKGHEINDGQIEVIGESEDKLTSFGIVYKGKVEEAHQASFLMTLVNDAQKAQEMTRLACVFLELAAPLKPDKGQWLAEYLPKIKPTAKKKMPKIRVFWDKLEVKMQHLGKMGGILITLNEEVKA